MLQSRPPPKTKSLTGQANQPICDKEISPLTWCSIPPAFSEALLTDSGYPVTPELESATYNALSAQFWHATATEFVQTPVMVNILPILYAGETPTVLASSRASNWLAIGSVGGEITLIDPFISPQNPHRLYVVGQTIDMAMSADGSKLAVLTEERSLSFWNVDLNKQIWTQNLDHDVNVIALNPDGTEIVMGTAAGDILRVD